MTRMDGLSEILYFIFSLKICSVGQQGRTDVNELMQRSKVFEKYDSSLSI